MRLDRESKKLRHALAFGAAAALLCSCTSASNGPTTAQQGPEKIFETNVTNNPYLSSGEPEIAVDPRDPSKLAIIEYAIGTGAPPTASAATNPQGGARDPAAIVASSVDDGRVMLSSDRGEHWVKAGVPPASDPKSKIHGGGDPMIAIGPDGTIYAADETPPASTGEAAGSVPRDLANRSSLQEYLSQFNIMVAVSTDGGHTFATPQIVGTPGDRPWLVVDQSTGMVYTVSSGALNVKTGVHNVAGPDAPNDRWLVAWQPHLTGKGEPHRLGGPDFNGSGGSTLAAAHGVVAATFVLGGPAPGGGPATAPVPVPPSLQGVVNGSVTSCSIQAPCLFFETSSDQGQHWTRHYVVVPGGFSGQHANVSADPGRKGHYAIAVLSPDKTKFLVLVTSDSGATWSQPVTVPETASGVDFKQWMAYGPTGVLGAIWRKERSDLTPPPPPAKPGAPPENPRGANAPAYDIYASISCDGGATWLATTRMNAETSPAGRPGEDDFSFIALDAHYAHLVWADHRMPPPGTPSPGRVTQAYYGRVPFSALSHGASCGRN